MQEIWNILNQFLGLDRNVSTFTIGQVILRATLIYLAGFILLRMGEHRFVGKNTAFDVVLGFIFGATLSRAINGTAPFIDTIAAGAALLALHWLFTSVAYSSTRADTWINGEAVPLVKDGQLLQANLRRKRINRRLLLENMRLNSNSDDLEAVQEAYYERNGSISIIPEQEEDRVRVLEMDVEDGVQTVRIELQG